ncbi:MAG: BglII/BstYI family type II restriction endonuclease [Rhodanobacteraceae bacterium]
MPISELAPFIREHYEVHEWRHATAILAADFPEQLADIQAVLTTFRLRRSEVVAPGGRKSKVAGSIDGVFADRGWIEKKFATHIKVDETIHETPTHKVDCVKGRVALEIEWNNKDPFYDRDLNNFRLLFDLRAISVGVIVTRCSHLQEIFNALGKGSSYGNSTTHMDKLLPRIEGGSGAGCPLLVFGISRKLYVED